MELLLSRRSEKSKRMDAPGPNEVELDQILKAGMRVPDHGKLAPWRFIIVEGVAQKSLGQEFAQAFSIEKEEEAEAKLQNIESFTSQAPILIIVISKFIEGKKIIPEVEQILSTGAACQNMLIAATSLGYLGQWLTGWAAYSPMVRKALKLEESDKIAGFLFFGSSNCALKERPRPDFDEIVSHWPKK